jgi:hypothetical protein
MTMNDLFQALTAAGLRLEYHNSGLVVRGGSMPDHVRQGLAEHDATLLALLAKPKPSPPEFLVDTAGVNGARAFMTEEGLRAWLKQYGRDPATVRVRRLGADAATSAALALGQDGQSGGTDWRQAWLREVGVLHLRLLACKDESVATQLRHLAGTLPNDEEEWHALASAIAGYEEELDRQGRLPKHHWPSSGWAGEPPY